MLDYTFGTWLWIFEIRFLKNFRPSKFSIKYKHFSEGAYFEGLFELIKIFEILTIFEKKIWKFDHFGEKLKFWPFRRKNINFDHSWENILKICPLFRKNFENLSILRKKIDFDHFPVKNSNLNAYWLHQTSRNHASYNS